MSSPVITISLHTRLPVVKHLMREHNIRRIPVVENDEIMGIITLGDVRNAFPSDASILNPFELSYLLEKVLARDIMRTQLFTIEADALLVDAARMMLEHRVSGLPVVEAGHLVGIITEADIFRAIVAGDVPLAASPYDLPLKAKTTI
jgi:CBS domain-containing protein